MKKLFFLLVALVALTTSCNTVKTNAGEEAVLVSKPIFGSGQIYNTPVPPASREYVAVTTSEYIYSTLPTKKTESFDNIMTRDNNPVDLNAHIILSNISGETPILHREFGKNYYTNNIREEFRSYVRNKVSDFDMHVLTTKRNVVDSLQQIVKNDLAEYVESIGLPVKIENVVIGKVTPPDEVLAQTVATAAQKQAELTYAAQTEAEAKRELSELARAKADQAYAKEMNMSVDQYLRSVELENQLIAIESDKDVSFVYGVPTTYIKQ